MADSVARTTIAVPPEDVWAVLADFATIATWAPNVDHSSLTTEVSDGVDAERRVQIGRNALLERIVEWQPGRTLGYVIGGLPPIIRSATNTWTLEPAESDGTIVTLTSSIDAGPRPPQQLVARGIARRMAGESRKMLTGLSAHLKEHT